MIDEATTYRLAGWLRLVPGDCLGIPLFTDGSNTEFIPETDDRLRITAFHACYNDEGYVIERRLPAGASQATYTIGTRVPIPFAKGNLTIIASSADGARAFLEGQGKGRDDPTVKAVAEILQQSETGAFERSSSARRELEFKGRHAAIFLEDPVHSRYWVEQLKRAALDVETLSAEGRPIVAVQLQMAANRWIERFRTSGDPALLGAFIREVENHRLGQPGFAKGIYYDVARHLLSTSNYKDLVDPLLARQIQQAIPEGLYYYAFNLKSLRRGKRSAPQDDPNLLSHMKSMIYDGEEKRDFRSALAAANLMFGREALHPDIHALAATTASRMVDLIERGVKSYSGRPPRLLVDDLVSMHRALVTLRQMMDWTERSNSTAVALGLSRTTTFLMKQWLEARA